MSVVGEAKILGHVQTTKLQSSELARQLVQHLGPTLVALIADVRDRKLPYKWAQADGPRPRDAALQRLQVAHRCWITVATAEGEDTARSWFIGANPRLDEESPAVTIRNGDFRSALIAAVAFVDGTDN